MEKLTKNELTWLKEAATLTSSYYAQRGNRAETKVERELAALRSEQLAAVAAKLQRTLDGGAKRIEIK